MESIIKKLSNYNTFIRKILNHNKRKKNYTLANVILILKYISLNFTIIQGYDTIKFLNK